MVWPTFVTVQPSHSWLTRTLPISPALQRGRPLLVTVARYALSVLYGEEQVGTTAVAFQTTDAFETVALARGGVADRAT